MTARNDWIAHLMHYDLKELRRRQDICNKQLIVAVKNQSLGAVESVQNMFDSLAETIDIKYGSDENEVNNES